MPSASINNQSSTKLVKQTSVNSVNSGGATGTSKGNKKIAESSTKTNSTNTTVISLNNETSNLKTAKENTNNVVAAAQQQSNKNWETSSAVGNNTSGASTANKDAGNDALNPMKLTFTTIEHKIRNLEKRKTKLEGYLNSGKELNAEQRAAVAKYDAVMATLEFARDLVKQMQQFTKDAEKEQKKQARKELIAKAQAETIKIREVLIIQNILSCFTDDVVRNDFLSGENGAAKLEPADVDILEKFCFDVQTRRPETSEDVPFATSAQKAAEIFSMTIDARPKQYGDTTYENVKRVFHRIQESDYLDKIYLTDAPETEIKTNDDIEHEENAEADEAGEADIQEQELSAVEENLDKLNLDAPTAQDTPAESNVEVLEQQQQVVIKEHLEIQPQVTLTNLPPQATQTIIPTPMAPPATAVPSFQPTVPAPHSGATTPVHVAIYHPSMQQAAPQHLQQIANSAALIGGVHTHNAAQILPTLTAQQIQQAGVQNLPPTSTVQSSQTQQQQQRQMLTSPAPGQPNVPAGPIAIHNGNPQQQPLPPGHFNPTTVHAVEQNFFKHQSQIPHQQPPPQQQQQQQYLQQMRPLAEVIGSGNFYFLQDSELDSPDLNNQGGQGVPQNTLVFEQQQQQPHQNLQPSKPAPHAMTELAVSTQNQQQQQQQQLQQLNQAHHPLNQPQNSTPTPIQTQTFTNQSFPQMPPPPPQQQQQQPQQHPSNTGLMQSNTPSPLFQQPPQQQQQQQQKATTNNQQIYSPVQNQNLATPHQQQQQPSQLIMTAANETPPANIMILNRLAAAGAPTTPLIQQQQQGILQQQQQQITPQNQNMVTAMQPQLPPNSAASDMSQAPKNPGFPFENTVVSGLGYEQQIQTKLSAEKVLNAFQEANNIAATHLHKNDLINEWDEAVLKSNNSPSTNSQQDYKPSASVQVVEASSTKWSAEVNANSPITIQQTSSRKNEWTSSAANTNNGNAVVASETSGGGYVNDNRSESNHWHSHDSNSYGRGSSGGNRGQGGGAGTGGYQRQRNDDRRDDRRPGGGGGGYRGRSNYGSGNPQQNGQSRGGGGGNSTGIYFRNNENSNNSYYQNGSGGGSGSNVYSNKDSRYDSRGGGGGNYRGPRGSDNSTNPRSNGPPPRHMSNRASGGNVNNTNSNSYMNSRQSNRMPLGIENKN